MDILITRLSEYGPFDVLSLDADLKAVCPKVDAVTVAHHCDPYAVFVHVSGELEPGERTAIEDTVAAHRGAGKEGASSGDRVY